MHPFGQMNWGDIWKHTVEKSQTKATDVTLHPNGQAVWGHIWKHTAEKSKQFQPMWLCFLTDFAFSWPWQSDCHGHEKATWWHKRMPNAAVGILLCHHVAVDMDYCIVVIIWSILSLVGKHILNDITKGKCDIMSHLVRSRGKHTVQCAHCAIEIPDPYVIMSQPPTIPPPLSTYLRHPWTASGLPVGLGNPPSQTYYKTNHSLPPANNICPVDWTQYSKLNSLTFA